MVEQSSPQRQPQPKESAERINIYTGFSSVILSLPLLWRIVFLGSFVVCIIFACVAVPIVNQTIHGRPVNFSINSSGISLELPGAPSQLDQTCHALANNIQNAAHLLANAGEIGKQIVQKDYEVLQKDEDRRSSGYGNIHLDHVAIISKQIIEDRQNLEKHKESFRESITRSASLINNAFIACGLSNAPAEKLSF